MDIKLKSRQQFVITFDLQDAPYQAKSLVIQQDEQPIFQIFFSGGSFLEYQNLPPKEFPELYQLHFEALALLRSAGMSPICGGYQNEITVTFSTDQPQIWTVKLWRETFTVSGEKELKEVFQDLELLKEEVEEFAQTEESSEYPMTTIFNKITRRYKFKPIEF